MVDDDARFRETLLRPTPRRHGSVLLGRAASLFARKQTWTNGTTLRVHFAAGSPPQLVADFQRFLREDLPTLGVTVQYTTDASIAHIRVAFDPTLGNGGASAVGTAATFIKPPDPTMILGTRGVTRYVVLHEMGHALGLLHEHQHPDAGIRWDMVALRRSMPHLSAATIRRNITGTLSRSDPRIGAGPFDPASVMMYDSPAEWTLGGCCAYPRNTVTGTLSREDRRRLLALYPPPPPPATGGDDDGVAPPPHPHRMPLAVYEWVFAVFCTLVAAFLAALLTLVARRARRARRAVRTRNEEEVEREASS